MMEISAALGVINALLLVPIIWYYFFKKNHTVKHVSLVPGWDRKPAHPQRGDLGVEGSLYSFLEQRHKEENSSIVAFWWRSTRAISTCSPQGFRDSEHLFNKPKVVFDATFSPLEGELSLSLINDSTWKTRREILQKPLRGEFVVTYLEPFLGIATEHCGSVSGHETIVELIHFNQSMTLKANCRTCFGYTFSSGSKSELEDFLVCYSVCKSDADSRHFNEPDIQSDRKAKFQKHHEKLKQILHHIISSYRQGRSQHAPFLDALLHSNLTEEVIMCDMITLVGGFYSSGFYLTWAIYYLSNYQDVQQRLFKKISSRIEDLKNIDQVKAYVLSSDTYLRQVLDESLRLSGTAPQSSHYSNEDEVIQGYLIPAFTPIIQVMGLAMQDNKYWDNPVEFNPDRFAPGSKNALRRQEFRPFGVSVPRRCPSNQFTYTMVSVFLSVLVKEFIVVPENQTPIIPKRGKISSPGENVKVLFRPRTLD